MNLRDIISELYNKQSNLDELNGEIEEMEEELNEKKALQGEYAMEIYRLIKDANNMLPESPMDEEEESTPSLQAPPQDNSHWGYPPAQPAEG